jgi:DNA-binding transcriptional LysR family regulator
VVDVDLRKLRYFVAVAEQLHFGRAAAELHIAQPVLSRQIRVLEDELKARLFERDRRSTALTAAGEQLLADARPLLAAAEALRHRVTDAARGVRTFTVGFMPGLIVTGAVRVLRARHPELDISVLRTSWDDQTEVLRAGRADVSYLRLPADQRGLAVRPLLAEPRVVVLPADHRLAGKETVAIADLADDHLLQDPAAVPEWRDVATELRSGAREPEPLVRTVEEKLEHVAAGRGVVVLPLSTATFYTRPDVVAVPVRDLGPNHVCIAWDAARRGGLVQEFVAIAEEQAARAVAPGAHTEARPPPSSRRGRARVVWQVLGEHQGAVLGDRDRVLGVGGARAVGRADGPAVGVEDDPVGGAGEPGFECQGHSRSELEAAAGAARVGDVGILVHRPSEPVAAELRVDRVAVAGGDRLDRR